MRREDSPTKTAILLVLLLIFTIFVMPWLFGISWKMGEIVARVVLG